MTALTAEMDVAEAPTALYRCFGSDGALLYIGISGNLRLRFKGHAETSGWWPLVARKTVVLYLTRASAVVAERKAIRSENPSHNVHRYPRRTRRVPIAQARKLSPVISDDVPTGPMAALYHARAGLGLSLLDVSRRCAEMGCTLSPQMLRRLEQGRSTHCVRAVPVLTQILGIDVAEIYCDFTFAARAAQSGRVPAKPLGREIADPVTDEGAEAVA